MIDEKRGTRILCGKNEPNNEPQLRAAARGDGTPRRAGERTKKEQNYTNFANKFAYIKKKQYLCMLFWWIVKVRVKVRVKVNTL